MVLANLIIGLFSFIVRRFGEDGSYVAKACFSYKFSLEAVPIKPTATDYALQIGLGPWASLFFLLSFVPG